MGKHTKSQNHLNHTQLPQPSPTKYRSHSHVNAFSKEKESRIRINFEKIIFRLIQTSHQRVSKELITFLSMLAPSEKPITSFQYIPSIQNMISEQHIQEEIEDSHPSAEFQMDGLFSEKLLHDHNKDLSVMYLCLLEKVMKSLKYRMTPRQSRKVMKGTWNIFIKFWKDYEFRCYENIGFKVEWGLLELINFDFKATKKQMFEAEQKIIQYLEKEQHLMDSTILI